MEKSKDKLNKLDSQVNKVDLEVKDLLDGDKQRKIYE